jgi:hypothetical protein
MPSGPYGNTVKLLPRPGMMLRPTTSSSLILIL